MSLETPTTEELSENIVSQMSAKLNQTIPLLPKSFVRVLAKVIAGIFILLYKYGGYIFLQVFVSTASTKETEINGKTVIPLVEWGDLIGVGKPVAATQAEHIVEVTVETQTGTLLSGTQLISTLGVTHITIGAVELNAPTKQVTIRAVADQAGGEGKGTIGNLNPGDIISFANPLDNVARDATVIAQTVTAANAEDWEVYRQRVKDRFQKRPQGGAYADYELWGEETAGIINVYPYTSTNPGQVDVYCEATVASSGNPDGIPTAAQLQAVLDSINYDSSNLATRRPANALVNAFAITRTGFDVRVIGLSVDDAAEVQADIQTAVTEYFLSKEPFIVGLSIPPRMDRITKAGVLAIVEDIVAAAGGVFTNAFIYKTGTLAIVDLYTLGAGEKAKLVNASFV